MPRHRLTLSKSHSNGEAQPSVFLPKASFLSPLLSGGVGSLLSWPNQRRLRLFRANRRISATCGSVRSWPCWLYEIKADRYRAQLYLSDGEAKTYSRTGQDCKEQFYSIAHASVGSRRKA